jgi:hypothetical protein
MNSEQPKSILQLLHLALTSAPRKKQVGSKENLVLGLTYSFQSAEARLLIGNELRYVQR